MRKCPKCGDQYDAPPAISRKDNKTEICPACSLAETLPDFFNALYEAKIKARFAKKQGG